jgi:sulfate/thiosulfate transport system substrate-binding protein
MRPMSQRRHFIKIPLAALLAAGLPLQAQQPVQLLNVSYDPTRELYVEFADGASFDQIHTRK